MVPCADAKAANSAATKTAKGLIVELNDIYLQKVTILLRTSAVTLHPYRSGLQLGNRFQRGGFAPAGCFFLSSASRFLKSARCSSIFCSSLAHTSAGNRSLRPSMGMG